MLANLIGRWFWTRFSQLLTSYFPHTMRTRDPHWEVMVLTRYFTNSAIAMASKGPLARHSFRNMFYTSLATCLNIFKMMIQSNEYDFQLNICSMVTNCIKSGAHLINHESRHLISNVNHYSSVTVRHQATEYYIICLPSLSLWFASIDWFVFLFCAYCWVHFLAL